MNFTASSEHEEATDAAPVPATPLQPEQPRTQFHTQTPTGRRLPDSLWDEYRLEVEFREEHGMETVSLAEFEDMRDWSDREPPQDVAWPALPYTVYERNHDDTNER